MTKPASAAPWATNANYAASTQPWASTPTKVAPPSGLQNEGINPEDPIVAQYENWWKNLVGQWTSHLNGTFTLIGRQVITANGTYTPTAGTMAVLVKMVGGGGGGGGATNTTANISCGAGGSSGQYFEKWISPGALVTGGAVAVGAAGTGGANTGLGGNNGGDSTIVIQGTTYTAKGGSGGSPMNLAGAGPAFSNGGVVSTLGSAGDVNRADNGGNGMALNSPLGQQGRGGSGMWGTGPKEITANAAAATGTSSVYGYGGGGGGGAGYNNTGGAGGDGRIGLVIVEEYA